MSMTNCVNCGSAKDVDKAVCPFCGTSYFDMTDVDLSGNKLCVLRLKLPGTNAIFQMKAYPRIANITFRPNILDVTGLDDRRSRYLYSDEEITCDLEFVCAR